jgi:molybdopterin synthase sulfur carrier subunit
MHRGGAYQSALAEKKLLRMAVNQEMVQATAPIKAGDEVAFFPPVTGG